MLSGRGHSSLSVQSSKAASGNKCNWLYRPHCILPSGHSEKLLHRLAPYQAVQRKKSLDSKGLAGQWEGLLADSGGQDWKSDDAASQNPAALAGLGRKSKLYNKLPFPPAAIQFPSPLFSLVLAHLQIFVKSISRWSACLWCAFVCWIIINCSGWLPLSRIHSLIWVPQLPCLWLFRPPFSPPLSVYLLQYAFIFPFSQSAWLSKAPHKQIKPQGAKTILLPFSSLLP